MKKNILIFGGKSCEHDISIITGLQCMKNIDKYIDCEMVYIGLDNNFYLATGKNNLSFYERKQDIKLKQVFFFNKALYYKGVITKKICDIDCVINCCHGGIGENGDLAGFFNVLDIKFTSSDCLPSHIAMNKNLTKKLVSKIVPTIKSELVNKVNFEEKIKYIKKVFAKDLIVKPNSLGSSIGVKVCDKTDFIDQINAVFEMNDEALVEERVVDIIEYNQACFKSNEGLVLSAIEQPKNKSTFLSFEDKYVGNEKLKGQDREIPAKISPELEEQIIDYTSKIYQELDMSGVVRIDYIFDKKNNLLYLNEINTVPGSLSYYLYEPIGIDYITLMKQTIDSAKEKQDYKYFDTQILKNKKF